MCHIIIMYEISFYQQAPQEIVSLFSGSRQVVYGFVPNCLQATLKAKIGSKLVETMVSTSDLAVTKGKVSDPTTYRNCSVIIFWLCYYRLFTSWRPGLSSETGQKARWIVIEPNMR